MTAICLMGFGEVGQILAADLTAAGIKNLSAYDILFTDPQSAPSRAANSVRAGKTAIDAVANADLIISAVTAASDLDAARSVAPGLKSGAFYLDLNSASPGMKRQAYDIITAAEGRYVEASVMTPFPPKRIASPMLLGGEYAAAFLKTAEPLGFKCKVFSPEIGKASATKMCRSVMIKGIESLLMESMLSARHYGVEKEVLASLSDLLPVGDWPKLAQYMISRSLEHGVRRAEEMRESARTVSEAGIEPLMTTATAQSQDIAARYKSALDERSFDDILDAVISQASHK